MIELPLTSQPSQKFTSVIEGTKYAFIGQFNSRSRVWHVDILLAGEPLAEGIPLLGGVDQLRQHLIGLKYMYVVNVNDGTTDANADNLGTTVKVVFLTEEELESASAV